MRRLLALTATAVALPLLAGCATASAGALDTKTPAPAPTVAASADRDAAAETCYQAGLDYIADDYADVVTESTTLEQIWARQHSINPPTVDTIPGGYSVLFEGSTLEGGFPSHLCELVDGDATVTTVD
jgi:hypothetical protein